MAVKKSRATQLRERVRWIAGVYMFMQALPVVIVLIFIPDSLTPWFFIGLLAYYPLVRAWMGKEPSLRSGLGWYPAIVANAGWLVFFLTHRDSYLMGMLSLIMAGSYLLIALAGVVQSLRYHQAVKLENTHA